MPPSKQPNIRMRRICLELIRLREAANLSGIQVADRLGVAPSTLSRLENGTRTLSRDDLNGMLVMYDAPRPLRKALLALHEQLNQPLVSRGDLRIHDDLADWIGLEQTAAHLGNFQPLLIPGLLQTFPYARAVIKGSAVPLSDQDIDDRVAARIGRQALLRKKDAPGLSVVLHEAALRHRVGGPIVMAEQLMYLVEAMKRPNIQVRVIPLGSDGHPGMNGPFVIMDYIDLPSLVHLENKVCSLYLDDQEDVEAYKLAWQGLLEAAFDSARSTELIAGIISDLG